MQLAERTRLLEAARLAARTAGHVVREGFLQPRGVGVHHKGAIDLVTDTDRRSEQVVREVLSQHTSLPILGEEEGMQGEPSDVMWVIDPIDGTTNFVQRLPHFAVSIGVWAHGRALLGVVYDVMRDEMFATDGTTAWLNDTPLPTLHAASLEDALLGSGFSYDRRTNPDNNFDLWEAFIGRCRCGRRMGSAALDLAWVAAGRLDGYWEANLKPWDFCAGVAIAEVVGARCTTYSGQALALRNSTMVCAPGELHTTMLKMIREFRRFPLYD